MRRQWWRSGWTSGARSPCVGNGGHWVDAEDGSSRPARRDVGDVRHIEDNSYKALGDAVGGKWPMMGIA